MAGFASATDAVTAGLDRSLRSVRDASHRRRARLRFLRLAVPTPSFGSRTSCEQDTSVRPRARGQYCPRSRSAREHGGVRCTSRRCAHNALHLVRSFHSPCFDGGFPPIAAKLQELRNAASRKLLYFGRRAGASLLAMSDLLALSDLCDCHVRVKPSTGPAFLLVPAAAIGGTFWVASADDGPPRRRGFSFDPCRSRERRASRKIGKLHDHLQ